MTPSDLQTWREWHGWTKAEAARQLGISRRHYDRIEHGQREITQTIADLADLIRRCSIHNNCQVDGTVKQMTDGLKELAR